MILLEPGMLSLTHRFFQKFLRPLLKSLTSEAQVLRTGWRLADGNLAQMGCREAFSFNGHSETLPTTPRLFSWQVDAVDRVVAIVASIRLIGAVCDSSI